MRTDSLQGCHDGTLGSDARQMGESAARRVIVLGTLISFIPSGTGNPAAAIAQTRKRAIQQKFHGICFPLSRSFLNQRRQRLAWTSALASSFLMRSPKAGGSGKTDSSP
jgi:hypothetical protein